MIISDSYTANSTNHIDYDHELAFDKLGFGNHFLTSSKQQNDIAEAPGLYWKRMDMLASMQF